MAKTKIDTTLIAGYESMTPEEKIAALEGHEIELPNPDYTGYVKKESFDKAAHDAAEWKKKYNAQLSDDELKRQQLQEENESMKEKLAVYEREKRVADFTARFATQGYEAKLAADTAEAMADGDMDKVFANQQKFIDQLKANKKAEDMKNTGKPGSVGNGSPKAMTKADFLKLSYEDQMAYKEDHPGWATELK